MSPVVITWLAIGIVAVGALAAVVVTLFKQLQRLAGSVRDFSGQVQPLLVSMREDAEQARQRAEASRAKAEKLRDTTDRTARRRR